MPSADDAAMNSTTVRREAVVSKSTATCFHASANRLRGSLALIVVALTVALFAMIMVSSASADTPSPPSPAPLPYPPTGVATGIDSSGGTAERSYTAISNIMKSKHDTVTNSISNVR
jgi:hypothetical protein